MYSTNLLLKKLYYTILGSVLIINAKFSNEALKKTVTLLLSLRASTVFNRLPFISNEAKERLPVFYSDAIELFLCSKSEEYIRLKLESMLQVRSKKELMSLILYMETVRLNTSGWYTLLKSAYIRGVLALDTLYLDKYWINSIGGLFHIYCSVVAHKSGLINIDKIKICLKGSEEKYLDLFGDIINIYSGVEQTKIIEYNEELSCSELANRVFESSEPIHLFELTKKVIEINPWKKKELRPKLNNKYEFQCCYGALHLRQPGFKESYRSLDDMRNVDVYKIHAALEKVEINLVQLGDSSMVAPRKNPRVRCVSHEGISPRASLEILANARFLIGSNSGMSNWASVLNIPALFLDAFSIPVMPVGGNQIVIPKIFMHGRRPAKLTLLLSDPLQPLLQTSSVSLKPYSQKLLSEHDYLNYINEFVENIDNEEYFKSCPEVVYYSHVTEKEENFRVPRQFYLDYKNYL